MGKTQSPFKLGDKIMRIKKHHRFEEGVGYEITNIRQRESDDRWLIFFEHNAGPWYSDRFKLLSPKKVELDYKIF